MIRGHAAPPKKLIFCTGDKDICAVKLRLFWLKLPKSPAILLIADLFWLLGVLSVNPVVFWGFLGETLDSKLT
jgi:hypothetical protein